MYFCIDKSTKNARSFSPTTSVSAKAAEAIVSQRLLSFCVISSATNKHPLSSAFGGHAVMFHQKPKLLVSHNKHLALNKTRGDKPPRVGVARQQTCHFVGFRYTDKMTNNADFGGWIYADRNRQILQWRFATHPLFLSGEFLVLLFRDKSTRKGTPQCASLYMLICCN